MVRSITTPWELGYTDRIIKLYLFSWTAFVTLCIGLLSLGITVYEESIVMNGSEFLSSVHTWHLRLSSSTECCSFSLSPIQLALSSLSLCSGRYSSLLRPSPLPLALAQAESASWAGWSLRGFWNFFWTTSATISIRTQKMEYSIFGLPNPDFSGIWEVNKQIAKSWFG